MIDKKKIKTFLLDRLKSNGFGFNHIRYESNRILKINNIISDGQVAKTYSPILKDNKQLLLDINFKSINVFEIDQEENQILIREIVGWQLNLSKTYRLITYIYEDYFYGIDDILLLLNDRKDKKDIHILMNSIYPELPIRDIKITNDKTTLYAGSGIFTFVIEKKIDTKKIVINTLFYGSGSQKYQKGNSWNLASRYKKIIKSNLNTQYVYDFNLNKFKNIYMKMKSSRFK